MGRKSAYLTQNAPLMGGIDNIPDFLNELITFIDINTSFAVLGLFRFAHSMIVAELLFHSANYPVNIGVDKNRRWY